MARLAQGDVTLDILHLRGKLPARRTMADTVQAGIRVPAAVLEAWCQDGLAGCRGGGERRRVRCGLPRPPTAGDFQPRRCAPPRRVCPASPGEDRPAHLNAADIRVIQHRGGGAVVDGEGGVGEGSSAPKTGHAAMAVTLAQEHGVGVVGVRNSSHFGIVRSSSSRRRGQGWWAWP